MEYIEQQPVRFLDRELFPHMVHVTRGLAEILECSPHTLLPMPSATAALNTVVRSWQRRFKPGPEQRVLTYNVAYGATKKLLRKVSEECGVQLDEAVVEFPLEGYDALLAALEEQLRPETSLVVLDAIPSNAPFVLPVEEAIAACRKLAPDAVVVVDAAHGLGGLPLKLREWKADAVLTNCHKWFCGPKGTALLYVPEKSQEWVEPLTISHGFGSDFVSGFYWSGLSDFSSWLALDATLAFWEGAGADTARIYCQYMALDAAEQLSAAWGTELGIPAELLGPMALVEVPALPKLAANADGAYTYEHAEALQNALFRRAIEVPIKVLPGQGSSRLYVRPSAHIYNCAEDYEVLQQAVLELADGAEL